MSPVRSCLSLLLVAFFVGTAWGQKAGDYIVVLRETLVKDGVEESQQLPAGELVCAYDFRDDAVWVSGRTVGWVARRDVASPKEAIVFFRYGSRTSRRT